MTVEAAVGQCTGTNHKVGDVAGAVGAVVDRTNVEVTEEEEEVTEVVEARIGADSEVDPSEHESTAHNLPTIII